MKLTTCDSLIRKKGSLIQQLDLYYHVFMLENM